jgi:preprotein translocase subunit SecG
MIPFLLNTALFLLSLFLILLVLVQRGRGGGLAGALGGAGGQSAFGTKAGDVFTKVTIGVAAFWILLCAAAVKYYRPTEPVNPFAGVAPQGASAGAPTGGTTAITDTGVQPVPSGTAPVSSSVPASTPAPSATGTGS